MKMNTRNFLTPLGDMTWCKNTKGGINVRPRGGGGGGGATTRLNGLETRVVEKKKAKGGKRHVCSQGGFHRRKTGSCLHETRVASGDITTQGKRLHHPTRQLKRRRSRGELYYRGTPLLFGERSSIKKLSKTGKKRRGGLTLGAFSQSAEVNR